MTFVQDSKSTSTMTEDTRTAAAIITQDTKSRSAGAGKLKFALLLPIFLQSSLASNSFNQDLKH